MKKIITSMILIGSLSAAIAAPQANFEEINDAPKFEPIEVIAVAIVGWGVNKVMDKIHKAPRKHGKPNLTKPIKDGRGGRHGGGMSGRDY